MTDSTSRPQEAASDASTPSKIDALLTEALTALQSDLGSSATAIEAGLFRRDGHGPLGTLFRAILDEKDPRTADELWSQLVGLGVQLWEAGYHRATIALYEDAQLRLIVPEAFAPSISEAIVYAKDQVLFERANTRFLEGDNEGALALADQMSNADEASDLRKQIGSLGRSRVRTRKLAFAFAACLFPCLVGATYFGVSNLAAFLTDPPKPSVQMPSVEDLIPDLGRQEPDKDAIGTEPAQVTPPTLPSAMPTAGPDATDGQESAAAPQPQRTSLSLPECAFNFRLINRLDERAVKSGSAKASSLSATLKQNFDAECAHASVNPVQFLAEANRISTTRLDSLIDNFLR